MSGATLIVGEARVGWHEADRVGAKHERERQAPKQRARVAHEKRVGYRDASRFGGTRRSDGRDRGLNRCARAQHVVDDQRSTAADVADDAQRFDGLTAEARLLHESNRPAQQFGVSPGQLYGAEIRGDDNRRTAHERSGRTGQQRHGREMVDRDVEEAFNGRCVRVDEHRPVEVAGCHDIGRDARPQRSPSAAAILTRMTG